MSPVSAPCPELQQPAFPVFPDPAPTIIAIGRTAPARRGHGYPLGTVNRLETALETEQNV